MTWSRFSWRRRAETRLTKTVLDGLPDAAALLDSAGAVLAANTALRLALSPAQPIRHGMPAARLFAPADRAAMEAWLSGATMPDRPRLAAPEGMAGSRVLPHRLPLPHGESFLLLREAPDRDGTEEADRLQTY